MQRYLRRVLFCEIILVDTLNDQLAIVVVRYASGATDTRHAQTYFSSSCFPNYCASSNWLGKC